MSDTLGADVAEQHVEVAEDLDPVVPSPAQRLERVDDDWPWCAVRVMSPSGMWRLRENASTWAPVEAWRPGEKAAPEFGSSIGYGTSTSRPPIASTMAARPSKVVVITKSIGAPARRLHGVGLQLRARRSGTPR